jgi:hypothetical protein
VKLLGYCAVDTERGAQRLLVYDYMPNKSLEDHLFSRVNPPLSWNRRLQIILGAAEGLAYLHEGVEVQVQFIALLLAFFLFEMKRRPSSKVTMTTKIPRSQIFDIFWKHNSIFKAPICCQLIQFPFLLCC